MFNLDDCYKHQLEFSREVLRENGYDPDNITREQLAELTIRFSFCMMVEMAETMGERQENLDWKMHRAPTGNFNPVEAIKELVDHQKYLWNLFGLWGIDTPEKFTEVFMDKSAVVMQRWEDEREALSANNNHS